ncbi:MAG: hypothetical protein Q4C00_05560 [Bacillota bacterium]|nr:hypothetical protein [Bacillota bacterium]
MAKLKVTVGDPRTVTLLLFKYSFAVATKLIDAAELRVNTFMLY